MKATALIVEYNPFHNGHLYHLEQSKKISQNENLIVIMSGNFTQRGDAAVLDKWARTKQALNSGADLVLELPLIYNIRSAGNFAYYSTLLLDSTNLVNSIIFGSESGNINLLRSLAKSLVNEKNSFKKLLKSNLKKGFNYPKARAKALIDNLKNETELKNYTKDVIQKALLSPNNILAIEYLKSLLKLNSQIKAHTITRRGTGYHSKKIKNNIASASYIRTLVNTKNKSEILKKVEKLMPAAAFEIFKKEIKIGRFVKDENNIINKTIDKLRRLQPKDLLQYNGIKNGLENRIIDKSTNTFHLNSFLENLNSKHLTKTRLRRTLLQIYFDLSTDKISLVEKNAPHYLRVLGVKKGKEDLLSLLKEKSDTKIIINPTEKLTNINLNSKTPLELSLSYDLLASDLYALLYQNSKHNKAHRDFYQGLIKI